MYYNNYNPNYYPNYPPYMYNPYYGYNDYNHYPPHTHDYYHGYNYPNMMNRYSEYPQNMNPNDVDNREIYKEQYSKEKKDKREEKKEKQKKSKDELILDYENNIRKEVEQQSPLISTDYNISTLLNDYKDNEQYLKIIEEISKEYKYIRKIRRDGNCFYRCFIFRLF